MTPPRFATPRDPDAPTIGPAVARVGAALGLPFHPWQIEAANLFGELDDAGRPRHRLCVLVVPRRAGKSALTLAWAITRILSGPDVRCGYTAQSRSDAGQVWAEEWWPAIEGSALGRLLTIRRAIGSESIKATRGTRPGSVRLLSPTSTAAHGTALDWAALDEAWAFDELRGTELEAGIRPAQATRPGAQLVILSAAGTEDSGWLRRYRDLGRAAAAAGDRSLAYVEFSADPDVDDLEDPATWARVHPAAGRTVSAEFLRGEFDTIPRAEFYRHYLGVWPETTTLAVLPRAAWDACEDPGVVIPRRARPVFAFDVHPDRRSAAVAVAAVVGDRVAVELVDHADGVEWVVPRLLELRDRHRGVIVVDRYGPAATLVAELERKGARRALRELTAADVLTACGTFRDAVVAGRVAHRGQADLTAAVLDVRVRMVRDRIAWDRRAADATALYAATLAHHGATAPGARAVVRSA